jgi:ATP synthase subunit 6
MFIFNPLEQFRILVFKNLILNTIDFSITNNTFILLFITFIFIFFFFINKFYFMPTKVQFILENIYLFVLQLFKQQINNIMAIKYFPLVLFIFIFILCSNLIGLLPYGFTITGHIILTFQIAFSVFIGITIIGFYNNKLQFLNLFVPSGVPTILIPFLVIIEFVSYLIRPFSLSIRLFANMLAGHTLLNIISVFTFNVFKNIVLLSILPILFILFIVVLEFSIAFVQAYIFSILVCIYLNDVYNVSH